MPDQTRNTIRVQLSMLPSDLVELDALAARRAEPGLGPNRSETFRHVLRSYLASETEVQEATDRRRSQRSHPPH